MRGIKDFNYPLFHECAAYLRGLDHQVIDPAEEDEEEFGVGAFKSETGDLADIAHLGFSLKKALSEDIDVISKSDAICLLPGWENSKGAQAEVAFAQAIGLEFLSYSPTFKAVVPGLQVTFIPDEPNRIVAGGGDASTEVRTVSSTGGEKGTKLARYDLIPTRPLEELAKHYGRGARKYDDHNWARGYEWSKSYAAMQRHAQAFWSGENIDEETGSPHIIAVAWHAFTLTEFLCRPQSYGEFDDRRPQ